MQGLKGADFTVATNAAAGPDRRPRLYAVGASVAATWETRQLPGSAQRRHPGCERASSRVQCGRRRTVLPGVGKCGGSDISCVLRKTGGARTLGAVYKPRHWECRRTSRIKASGYYFDTTGAGRRRGRYGSWAVSDRAERGCGFVEREQSARRAAAVATIKAKGQVLRCNRAQGLTRPVAYCDGHGDHRRSP